MKTPILANHDLCKVSDVMHKETDITQRGGAESMYGFFYYIYPHIAIFFGGGLFKCCSLNIINNHG